MPESKKIDSSSKPLTSNANDKNIVAALSYLWILSVVLYVLKKDDKYIEFHAKQGMVLFVLSFLGMFPVLGWPLWVISFLLIIVGALKAYKGEKYRIPLIADVAEKIKF